jgi:DNA excision repair protein ERCC-2
MKRYLQVAVRELVEYTLRSGDLVRDFSFVGGDRARERSVEGIHAHQRIQSSRPSEYRSEVTIAHQVESGDHIVTISGRIDGVYRYTDPDRAVIDEIKTTTHDPDSFAEENPIHWGQAKVYAYLYALKEELETMEVQLTYYRVAEPGYEDEDSGAKKAGKTREFRKSFTFKELETFFHDLLNRYLGWLSALEKWRRQRDQSIKELTFPYPVFRPGQQQMIADVFQAVEKGEQLIVEAPTGIGKTMAAIFPAVKALGSGLMEKFFYLTAKTTGREVARKALEDLGRKGLRFKSLTLTAREKICFKPGSACNGEECEFARGYFDRINEATAALFQGDTDGLTRQVIETAARQFTLCPFEFSLELSLWVDAIICDYNYAFDPRVYLKRFFGEENNGSESAFVFLVDEANNLVDRSREMFSAELFKQSFPDLKAKLKSAAPTINRALNAINTQLVRLKQECEEAGKPLAWESYPADLVPPLRRFTQAIERWLARNTGTKIPFRQELMTLYFDVSWFLKVAEIYNETYATCLEMIDNDFRVKLFCIDPSRQLAEAFQRCTAAIFFSATLSPLDYFRHILGCDPSARESILPSPFPQEHLCLPTADRVSTLYKYRERTKTTVTRIIHTLVNQHPGNYLVFFPSYQYMKMIYELFAVMNPMPERIVQTPGMSEAERDAFLENFTVDNRANGKTLVGFAVMGGVFGEGIDLAGDRLTGAAIVGVGLPGISLERELIKEYFTQLQGTGFEYAYLYPGMNRVFQAAGRVIRSAEDRGVVLLIDHRFTTTQYRSLLPPHWNPIRVRDEQHLKQILSGFWNNAFGDP